MATSSFTKNFKVRSKDAEKFVKTLSTKNSPKMLNDFESKYTHPVKDSDLIKKALSN